MIKNNIICIIIYSIYIYNNLYDTIILLLSIYLFNYIKFLYILYYN